MKEDKPMLTNEEAYIEYLLSKYPELDEQNISMEEIEADSYI